MTSLPVCVVDLNGAFGPLKSFLELAPHLEAGGIDLRYVVPSDRRPALADLIPADATLAIEAEGAVRRDVAIAAAVARAEPRPAVVHANSTSAARGAALAGLRTRAAVLVHLRNSALSRSEQLFVRALATARPRTGFVAVSSLAATIAGLDANRTTVLRDAVTSDHRRTRAASQPLRVGVVANRLATKGFDVFTGVAAATRDLPVTWEVFGSAGATDRPRNDYLDAGHAALAEAGLTERVHFHGLVDDLREHLPDLDVLLLTSRRESFSRVAVECLLAGLPLIAPDIEGLAETIDGDRFATRYPVADVAGASAVLRAVVEDHPAAVVRADAGAEWARDRFAPANVAADLAKIYRQLAGA